MLAFDDFQLDLERRELRREGSAVELDLKPLTLLCYLVQNRDRAVPKDELLDQVWPDVVVSDSALSSALKELRRALGDDGASQRYVQTLRGRGLRFVAATREAGAATVVPGRRSIAVLPFANQGSTSETEYLADGIAEELIDALARIPTLRVIARTSSFAFKGAARDVREIARTLEVESVLEGSVRRSGERIRVTAQLVDAEDGSCVWSERFDRTLDDVFAIQDEIAGAIVRKLEDRAPEPPGLVQRPTHSMLAYELYLRGRYFWSRRDAESLSKALALFEEALEADPDFAQAWAGVADVHSLLACYGRVRPIESYERSRAAATRALELQPDLVEAHTSLAHVQMALDWDWEGAERRFRHALSIDDRYSTAHHWYAILLGVLGRFDEASAEVRQARLADPLNVLFVALDASVEYLARRYDIAVARARSALEMDPELSVVRVLLAVILAQRGDAEEAIAVLEEHPSGRALSSGSESLLADFHARTGDRSRAREVLEALDREAGSGYASPIDRVAPLLSLDDVEGALGALEAAHAERSHEMIYLAVDPVFDPLRDEPRFQAILESVGFPQAVAAAGRARVAARDGRDRAPGGRS